MQWKHALINSFLIFLITHLTISILLFCICGYIATSMFKSIQQQIPVVKATHILIHKMTLLHYINAREMVDAINNCFGWIFLATTPFCLIGFITDSFSLFGSNDAAENVNFFIIYAVHFVIMCYTADRICNEVIIIISFVFFFLISNCIIIQ